MCPDNLSCDFGGRWRRWAADLSFQKSVSALRGGDPSWLEEMAGGNRWRIWMELRMLDVFFEWKFYNFHQ